MGVRPALPHSGCGAVNRIGRWLLLWGAVALFAGCQHLVAPLDRKLPEASAEAATPQALMVVACWEAEPLAELLRTAYERQVPDATALVILTNNAQVLTQLENGQAAVGLVSTLSGVAPTVPSGWVTRELARDGIALVVNRSLPIAGLKSADLTQLYGGLVADWSALGAGEGAPVVVTREHGAVPRLVFEALALNGIPVTSTAVVQPHTRATLDYVAATPGALAYVPSAQVDERVKVVALDDCLPTVSQIDRGRYPLVYSLWLVLPVSADGFADAGALRLATYALSARGQGAIGRLYGRP